jgi:molybdopterin-guanine dinucleotide biosynthesis protein MobB
MHLVAFCGPSNSGKTWMIERIARRWTEAGFRVGVLKHCSKGYELDREGKDSDRFWGAGAAVVGVVGPSEYAVRRREPRVDPMRVIAESFPTDLDVAILEGFSDAQAPRVRVYGDAEAAPARPAERGVVACVSRSGVPTDGVPFFRLDDDAGLSSFLARRLGLGHLSQGTRLLRHERSRPTHA